MFCQMGVELHSLLKFISMYRLLLNIAIKFAIKFCKKYNSWKVLKATAGQCYSCQMET